MNLLHHLKRSNWVLSIIDRLRPSFFYQPQRRHVSAKNKLEAIQRIGDLGGRFVLIRWIEDLLEPSVGVPGDLDFLIEDRDVDLISALPKLKSPESVPCDFFTVSGLDGFGKGSYPEFPPNLARRILSDLTVLEIKDSQLIVPKAGNYLLSSIFHTLYHVGPKSNIAYRGVVFNPHSRRDYSRLLRDQIERSAWSGSLDSLSFESLESFLHDNSFVPGLDFKIKVAETNPWVRTQVLNALSKYSHTDPGLSLLILNTATALGLVTGLDYVKKEAESVGMSILGSKRISGSPSLQEIRSGNWPLGVDTEFASVLLQTHASPLKSPQGGDLSFLCDNPRLQFLKRGMRAGLSRVLGTDFIALHSSDSKEHSGYYLDLLKENH